MKANEPKKVDDFENWDVPELATAIGTLMLDLRGSWNDGYTYRMRETIRMLEALRSQYESMSEKDKFVSALHGDQEILSKITSDIVVTESELHEPYDGRIFRGCNFYGHATEDGKTDRIKMYLYTVMTYPEYSWMEVDEDDN